MTIEHLVQTVEAAQRGEERAFEQLLRGFQDGALAVALTHLGDYHQAQDAVQEAFVEAYLRLPQLQAPIAFRAWLHKIVLGKCVRLVRGGKSAVAALSMEMLNDVASSVPDPESILMETNARQALRIAMQALSEEERQALLLYAVGGYRYAEIGEMMQLPLSLIKKRIYTARQQLRGAESLEALRPSRRPELIAHVRQRAAHRQGKTKEKLLSAVHVDTVELVGPGIEYKQAIKNLYAFYRYELMPFIEGDLPVPSQATEDNWSSGAWVNQHGVLNGLQSTTHEESVKGEDVFWEWPTLQAFLIRWNGWPVGFAMVASPPNATPGVNYRLQELFVINKARGKGIATKAMRSLFDRLPGKWELAYDPKNTVATEFWQKFIPAYTGGDFAEEMIGMGWSADLPGYVFTSGPK